jgi:hypothetical protein
MRLHGRWKVPHNVRFGTERRASHGVI